MKTLVERLREEADDSHKNWYRVATDEQRELCRALTLEAADRIAELESALNSLWPGLVLDLRYADADDDIDAMQSRVDTIAEVMAGTGTASETPAEPAATPWECHFCKNVFMHPERYYCINCARCPHGIRYPHECREGCESKTKGEQI